MAKFPFSRELLHHSFNVKDRICRPLFLLLDALGVLHGIRSTSSWERISELERIGVLTRSIANVMRNALDLGSKLRFDAHIYYDEEKEEVSPVLDLDQLSTHPYLLSCEDYKRLRECHVLLFEPLSQFPWEEGVFHTEWWQEAYVRFLEELVQRGEIGRAQELMSVEPCVAVEAQIALLEGAFLYSLPIARSELQVDRKTISGCVTLFLLLGQRAVPFFRLVGYLENLQIHPIPQFYLFDTSQMEAELRNLRTRTEFTREGMGRILQTGKALKKQLFLNLQTLLSFPLPRQVHEAVWRILSTQLKSTFPQFPRSMRELLEEVYSLSFPEGTPVHSQGVTFRDLFYVELISRLKEVHTLLGDLPPDLRKEIYLEIFRYIPPEALPRCILELNRMGLDPEINLALLHLPLPNGKRPLHHCSFQDRVREELSARIGSSDQTRYRIKGVSTSQRFLHEGLCGELERGGDPSATPPGRRLVVHANGAFLKLFPEFPGRQLAATALEEQITGESPLLQDLLRIEADGMAPMVGLVSAEVLGVDIREKIAGDPTFMARLDRLNYSRRILMDLLVCPEDGNPNNLMVRDVDGVCYLIPIDFDRVFVDSFRDKIWGFFGGQVSVKTLLYCMDSFLEPFDPDLVQELSMLDVGEVMSEWLRKMEAYNTSCLDLFGEGIINGVLEGRQSEVPFFIQPSRKHEGTVHVKEKGWVQRIYERLSKIQQILKENPKTPMLEVLRQLDRPLAELYGKELEAQRSPIERFANISRGQYKSDRTRTETVIPIRFLRWEEFETQGYLPRHGAESLGELRYVLRHVDQVKEDLLLGEGEIIRRFNFPGVSEEVLKGIDFSQIPSAEHDRILGKIMGLTFTRLHLSGCHITDARLQGILQTCPHLTFLDLGGSRGIQNLSYFQTLCPLLKTLNLRNASGIHRPLLQFRFVKLSHLESLDLRGTSIDLAVTLVFPVLKVLRIDPEPHLRHVVNAPSIEELVIHREPEGPQRSFESIKNEAILRGKFQEDHVQTATAYHELAIMHSELGNYKVAYELHTQARRIRFQTLGVRHPDSARSYSEMILNAELGRVPSPFGKTMSKHLDLLRELFGEEHPDTARGYYVMGKRESLLGNYEVAAHHFGVALRVQIQVLGADHPTTRATENEVARWALAQLPPATS